MDFTVHGTCTIRNPRGPMPTGRCGFAQRCHGRRAVPCGNANERILLLYEPHHAAVDHRSVEPAWQVAYAEDP